jgi:hypothetical protein
MFCLDRYLNPDEGGDVGLEPGGFEALQKAADGTKVAVQKIPIKHKVGWSLDELIIHL